MTFHRRNDEFYFTIHSFECGIGDHLLSWVPVYSLLTELGFVYLHSPLTLYPFHSTENSQEIGAFLGFDFFPKIRQGLVQEDIPLEEFCHICMNAESIVDVREYLFSKNNKAGTVYSFNFKIGAKIRPVLKKLPRLFGCRINRDLASYYLLNMQKNHPDISLRSDKINIVVLVRRGDIAKFKLDNKVFWGTKIHKKYLLIEEYERELKRVIEQEGMENCHILIFSDGNRKGVLHLERELEYGRRDDITREDIYMMKQIDYDKEFDIFKKYRNVNFFISDDFDRFKKAFYAMTCAEIVIGNHVCDFFRISNYFKINENQRRYCLGPRMNDWTASL